MDRKSIIYKIINVNEVSWEIYFNFSIYILLTIHFIFSVFIFFEFEKL